VVEVEQTSDSTDWASPRVDLLPASLLQDGELVILFLKPSPWFIVLGGLRFLLAVLVVLVPAMWLEPLGYGFLVRRDLILLSSGAVGARLFWEFLEWLSRTYVLTDRRVIRIKGVMRVQVFEAPLSQIQHTVTTFALRERLFGLGTIGFATAGTAFVEAYWEMLSRPLDVHKIVVQTLDRYRR
jgi:uncharacterized membrane protein YdbT with pleckstrin-like domain